MCNKGLGIVVLLIALASLAGYADGQGGNATDTSATDTNTEVACEMCGGTACMSTMIIYFGLGISIGWYLGYNQAPKFGKSRPTWFFLGLCTNVLALVVWYVVKSKRDSVPEVKEPDGGQPKP